MLKNTTEITHKPYEKLQEARTKALFNNIGDAAIITDEKGKIEQINKVALQMFGYKKEEVTGKWFHEIIAAQDEKGNKIPEIDRPITKSFMTGKPVSQRLFYVLPDGNRIVADVTVSPITHDGKPVGAIEITRDVTREREIDKMKTEFIGIASHQLRTPLTALKTYAHLLSDEVEGWHNEKAEKYLSTILQSTTRMNEIINTLLNISRIESGILNVDFRKVDLSAFLESIHNELYNLSNEKDIRFSLSIPDKKYVVATDKLLLAEIVSNLIANAVKYTEPGGSIVLKLGINKDKEQAIISVADTGIGIPSHFHSQIFTKFFRSPNATTVDASGNGLGLYMAKQMADAIHADLYFDSEEGEGSIFCLTLPLKST